LLKNFQCNSKNDKFLNHNLLCCQLLEYFQYNSCYAAFVPDRLRQYWCNYSSRYMGRYETSAMLISDVLNI
jgi:hypothetical protein